MASPKQEIATGWVLCKDFLTDAIWAQLHGKTAQIFGFRYQPGTDPELSLDPVLVVVRNKTKSNAVFDKEIQQSLKFINLVEARMSFSLSTLQKVDDGTKHSVWLFTCPKEWVHAPPMFSMLTLFLRVGCHYKGGGKLNEALNDFKKNVKHNDSSYLKSSRKLRLLIMKYGLSIFDKDIKKNYPADASVGTIHNSSGIVNSARSPVFKKLYNLSKLESMGKKETDEMTGKVHKKVKVAK